jgi:hypothetical protein
MQAQALTRTRYFYSLNVIISHPIVYKEGPGYLSVCAISSRSSPPTHLRICNGQRSSELFCVHCTSSHDSRKTSKYIGGIHHHHHQWHYSPESGLVLPYGFRDRYITMWVISPTINLILVILNQPPETSSGKATTDI